MNWNEVHYIDGKLNGEVLPPDGKWLEWKDSDGNIEVARFKYDAEDHFYPNTRLVKGEKIAAWRYKE